MRSLRFAEPPPALCLFEFVYLGRADSRMYGRSLHEARKEMGRRLAREAPVDADMVVPVPDTAVSAAQGYAEASGIPYGDAMMKNRYIGRTFIEPTATLRQRGVKLKLNPMPDAVRGRRLVVVDDSIVRGTTTRQLVQALKEAGAAADPPAHHGAADPVAVLLRDRHVDEGRVDRRGQRRRRRPGVRGADSLAFLSLDALVAATEAPKSSFCRACFDGELPRADPDGVRTPAKFALEPR